MITRPSDRGKITWTKNAAVLSEATTLVIYYGTKANGNNLRRDEKRMSNIYSSGPCQSKKGGKDQESIQSSTTPDPGYHMG